MDPSISAELLLQPEALLSNSVGNGKDWTHSSGKLTTFQGPLWMRVPVVAIVSFGGSDEL